MDANWIVAAATVVVAGAAIGSAIAAKRYADLTLRLILEQRESQLNDKFPCIVVRSRLIPRHQVSEGAFTRGHEELRLVNVGRGPAFIEYFRTTGMMPSYQDGDHTTDIDKVIGPDNGDPDLQIVLHGRPAMLQKSEVTIEVRYHDIAGRAFTSGIRNGKPFYEPPW